MATAPVGRVVAAGLVAALLAACTATGPEPEPAPTPSPSPTASEQAVVDRGARIAVIVPPASVVAPAEAAVLLRAAGELAASPPEGVAEVRVVEATSEPFVRDLAHLAVDDGLELVCVVGTGSAELVLELARARREGRFCTTDPRIAGGPVNLVSVGVDPAALIEAGAVAIGTASPPVGLLLSPQIGDGEALTDAFTSTVAPPRQPPSPSPAASPPTASPATPASPTESPAPAVQVPTPPQPPFVTITAGPSSAAQASAAEQLAEQRPSRALVLATPGGAAAARAAAVGETELVAVSDWVVDEEGEAPPGLLVALTVDWEVLLRQAIAAGRTPDAPQVQLLGITGGVLGAVPGQLEESVAAAERTIEHLRRSEQ